MKKFLLPVLLFIALAGNAQTNPFQKRFPLIDRYLDSLMKEWNIPGMALGIVYRDQLVYAKGYGYRDLEKKLPVDANTIFPIASNTKLFTATLACMLQEEGKLDLNAPVRTYMPALRFSTDELNTKVTLRDMLGHRTGLPRYDGIWVAAPYTRKEMISKVAYMKPVLGFREGYIYNNMMYASAGAVMENITGSSWEDLVREKLFLPLQMNASGFTEAEMMRNNNYSLSYFEPDSSSRLLPEQYMAQSIALGPAGTIKTNINDISHWMIAQLNEGRYMGHQVIPAGAIRQTLVPNIIADKMGKYDELSNSLYAMGRTIQTYKGLKVATHTGSIDGFYSSLTFVPGEQLAVFIVHNSSPAGSLRSIIGFALLDRLLGLSYTPWSQRYRKDYLEAKAQEKHARDSVMATQVRNTSPSHALAAYAGTYSNPVYGDIRIELKDNQLVFIFRRQTSILWHFHYDQFITREEHSDTPDFRLHFITGNSGDIESLTTNPFGDPAAEFIKAKK